tara:strand:- start:545 stop:913 length:369 start_codon:yes stop_codon:yes gene_type:complete
MRPSEAQKILENPKDHTVQERKDAKEVMAKVGSLGQDKTTPLKRSKGGDTPGKKKGKVPVIAISVGMAEMPKGQKKTAMMRGGMANGKQHMYAAGGVVNDGLKALKASGPKGLEAFNKITGK